MHRRNPAPGPGKRTGFTLIEMLVVLGIVLMMSVLTVLFMPRIQERQRVAQGADLLQGWALMAKQRALRDRVATGLRFQLSHLPTDPPNQSYVRDIQYIQQPDDYSQGLVTRWRDNVVTFTAEANLQRVQNLNQGNEANIVQPGDYLLLRGEGLPTRITSIINPTSLQVLDSGPQIATPSSYRISRQPRLLAGEQPLQLPQNVAIDLSLVTDPYKVPTRQPGSYLEILFSPSGRVVGQGTGNAPIVLRVRDVTLDPNAGDQTLIVIYPLTGSIAAHPVAQGGDPYLFIRDGRSSGF
jgi:prepilin-type N-terminal cleavage/methylation domain-containing protein